MRDVARDHDVATCAEADAQLAARGRRVLASQRVVRVVQVPDVPLPHGSQDGRAARHPAGHEGAPDARLGSKRPVVADAQACRGLEPVRGRSRQHVERPAHGVAA